MRERKCITVDVFWNDNVQIKNPRAQNRELRGIWENRVFSLFLMRKRLYSGQKWFLRPRFPLFRGIFVFTGSARIEKEEKVILVSENDLFLTLGLGTSSAQNKNLRPLLNANTTLFSGKYCLKNHFWPLESRFLMRKSEKNSIFSKFPRCLIFKFLVVTHDVR